MWSTSVIKKTTQIKQSPNGRKIGQSGHPDLNLEMSAIPMQIASLEMFILSRSALSAKKLNTFSLF
jgi:hypothetical protein